MTRLRQGASRLLARWLYGLARQDFHTAMMQQFLRAMLQHDTMELKWTIQAEYEGGHRDLVVMSIRIESLNEQANKRVHG